MRDVEKDFGQGIVIEMRGLHLPRLIIVWRRIESKLSSFLGFREGWRVRSHGMTARQTRTDSILNPIFPNTG